MVLETLYTPRASTSKRKWLLKTCAQVERIIISNKDIAKVVLRRTDHVQEEEVWKGDDDSHFNTEEEQWDSKSGQGNAQPNER